MVYRLFFLLHVGCVVIGFGSSFVYPVLAVRARKLAQESPAEAHAINHAALGVSKVVTPPFIYAAGALGVILVILGNDRDISFSQLWISLAFVLFIAAACIAIFLHTPNLRAMDELEERLIAGGVPTGVGGTRPKEVAELEERGKKAAMYGGILHLFWLALMIDMIWQPGRVQIFA